MQDSQLLAMTIGQKSHRRPVESTNIVVLQSGKPGVSAMTKAVAPCGLSEAPTSAIDGDIVGGALAGAAIPGDQQIAVGAFDDSGGVVVIGTRGKDQFVLVKRGWGGWGRC